MLQLSLSLSRPKFCRVCRSPRAVCVGRNFRPYCDYKAFTLYECPDCGCRAVDRDRKILDILYSPHTIAFDFNQKVDAVVRRHFRSGRVRAMREALARDVRFRFVLEHLDNAPPDARVLEVGCSLGYLTAYGILAGRRIVGADVAEESLARAARTYGPHFLRMEEALRSGERYDLVYHTGLISSVEDPLGLTSRLMGCLAPGGVLVFNASNRDALIGRSPWLSTAPPDSVTIFPRGFWERRFPQFDVAEQYVEIRGVQVTWTYLDQLRSNSGRAALYRGGFGEPRGRSASLFDFALRLQARMAGPLFSMRRPRYKEFGVLVKMRKPSPIPPRKNEPGGPPP